MAARDVPPPRERLAQLLRTLLRSLVLLVAAAPPLAAHVGEPLRPHDLAGAWTLDPWVLASIALPAFAYWRGTRRLWARAGVGRGVRRWQVQCFAAGIAALFVALVSPLDQLGGALFSAHMAQHQLLMVVAAPLLVLGAPQVATIWAFPFEWRRRLGTWGRRLALSRGWKRLIHPGTAWTLHAAAIWLWHAPALYERTLDNELVHVVQHTSFFGSALLFWWSVAPRGRPGGRSHGPAILSIFATAVHGSALGALLTFSATPWYPVYAGRVEPWGLTLLEDQQLGGLVMWVPAGIIYTGAALIVLAVWLRSMEQRMEAVAIS